VEYGTAAERLAAVAERERASLLITGSRGRGRSASALLGSVASRLAASVTRPLVIVPSGDGRAPSTLTTRRLRSGAALLCVHGEIDPTTAYEIEDAAHRLLDETGRLVIDLSDTTTIERAGMRIVERLARRASDTGERLALVTPAPAVRQALDGSPHPVTDALDAALEVVTA
jgi:anti-anti-sigma factor